MRDRIAAAKVVWPLLIAIVLLTPGAVVTAILLQQNESPPIPGDAGPVDTFVALQPVILPLHVGPTDARTPPLGEDGGQEARVSSDEEEVSGPVYAPEDEGGALRRLSQAEVLALLESTPRGLREPWKPGASREVLELSRSDLAGIDLESVDLTFVKFNESNLSGANLRNAVLRNSGLSEATWQVRFWTGPT